MPEKRGLSRELAGAGVGRMAGQAVASVGKDLRRAAEYTLLNRVAGSVWMPRVGRLLILRLAGLDVDTPNVAPGVTFLSRDVAIGSQAFVNWGVVFEGGPIRVGANTMVGHQVAFITADHPRDETGRPTAAYRALPIEVGAGCWLGARVTVLGGVRVADGCIVAAGSVVTSDLDEPGTYAGVPARLVRSAADRAAS